MSAWYCCNCGDGPHNGSVTVKCTNCSHEMCSSCSLEGKSLSESKHIPAQLTPFGLHSDPDIGLDTSDLERPITVDDVDEGRDHTTAGGCCEHSTLPSAPPGVIELSRPDGAKKILKWICCNCGFDQNTCNLDYGCANCGHTKDSYCTVYKVTWA